jgi:hypothetical protein
VLRLRTVKQQLMRDYAAMYLPWSEYAAMRSAQTLGDAAAGTRTNAQRAKRKALHQSTGGVKGEKKYKVDYEMDENKDRIALHMCSPC